MQITHTYFETFKSVERQKEIGYNMVQQCS